MREMPELPPFHYAFPVHDLALARDFYLNTLGCTQGRSDETWIDFNLFGHQIVAHFKPQPEREPSNRDATHTNPVDGHDVPVPHFGVVLAWDDWQALADKLKAKQVAFVIEPHIRFAGKVGEQATMFLLDPSGNALEFKAFRDLNQLFAVS